MARSTLRKRSATKRMTEYRKRMRAAGLRPVQIWLPDTRSAAFAAACRREARAIAANDPDGEEVLRLIEGLQEWPEN